MAIQEIDNHSWFYQVVPILTTTTLTDWKRSFYQIDASANMDIYTAFLPHATNVVEPGTILFTRIDGNPNVKVTLHVRSVVYPYAYTYDITETGTFVHQVTAMAHPYGSSPFQYTLYNDPLSVWGGNMGGPIGTSGLKLHLPRVNSNTTLYENEDGAVVDATSGGFSLILPKITMGTNITTSQRMYLFREDVSGNAVTLTPNGTDTIEGVSSYSYTSGGLILLADSYAKNWKVFPQYQIDNTTLSADNSGKLGIKPLSITDGLIADSATIVKAWSNTVTYSLGEGVVYNNGYYISTIASNLNNVPSFTTNNWVNVANYPEFNKYLGYVEVTANYSQSRGDCRFVIPPQTANITITMLPISTLRRSSNLNHLMKFWFFKLGQAFTVTVQLSGSDTFTDGTTAAVLSSLGTEIEISAIMKTGYSVWTKGL